MSGLAYDQDKGLSSQDVLAARAADGLVMNKPQPAARHALRLHVLASGSSGNAAVVENAATGRGFLIDCGICKRDFFDRCDQAGFDPANLDGVVISHDHTDHTKGLGVVLRGLLRKGVRVPVYADDAVRRASKHLADVLAKDEADFCSVRAGQAISLAGCQVHLLRSSHDAAASFGFRVECGDLPAEGQCRQPARADVLGFLTDTGVVTPECREGLAGVRLLALESNHDPAMLKTGPYPYYLKERVASDWGHLSNGQACAELAGLLHAGLEQVIAMHVSRNNNTYRLPLDAMRACLSAEGHEAQASVAYQNQLVSVV